MTAGVAREPRPWLTRLRELEFRNELLALAAVLVAIPLFPRSTPLGVYATGGVAGAAMALHAVGLIVVYKANRFVNFAQLQLAVFAATVFTVLMTGQKLLDGARAVCGCISREPTGVPVAVNFVLALVIGLVAAPALAFAFYATVLRRFSRAPRLMLTVVSVFAAQALHTFGNTVGDKLGPPDGLPIEVLEARSVEPPWHFVIDIGGAQLNSSLILLVLVAIGAIVGVSAYLRKSDTGVAIRAAAENPARAQTVGVDVVAVTGRVWILAGFMAGVAGVMGAQGGGGVGGGFLLDALTLLLLVAVLARFSSLWMVAPAALVVGILDRAVPASFGSDAPLKATLVLLVGGLLLMQRRRTRSRAEREDASGFDLTREVRPIPAELRHLPQVKAWVRNATIGAAVVVLGIPWMMSGTDTTSATRFVIFMIVGLSVLVVTGWAGQVSLGQFGFAAIGAWVAAVSGMPMPIALVLGGVGGAVAAVVVGLPALRLGGLNLAITSLAFAVSAPVLFLEKRYLGRHLPREIERPSLLGMNLDDPRVFYYCTVALVVGAVWAVVGLRRSRTGRALIAVRANEATGQSFGVDPLRLRLTAFAISGFLAAFAGALFAFHQRVAEPAIFDVNLSLDMFLFSVIGGLGGVAGPILGFTFMAVVNFVGSANPIVRLLSGGTGAILLLMASPGGLAEVFYGARDSALRRLAVRLRIPVPSLMGEKGSGGMLEQVQLDDTPRRSRGGTPPLRYKLPNQWALDRFGAAEGGRDRVGAAATGDGGPS